MHLLNPVRSLQILHGKHQEAAVDMHAFLDMMDGMKVAAVEQVSVTEHAKRKLRNLGDQEFGDEKLIKRMARTLARFKAMLVTQR